MTKLVSPPPKPGSPSTPAPNGRATREGSNSHLRLCFALPSKEQIRDGVAAFARVCFEQTGIPERSANTEHAGRAT